MKKDLLTMIGEDLIKQIDCKNCIYAYYDPGDIQEKRQCAVPHLDEKPERNESVMDLMKRGILLEFGCHACEYFDLRRKIKS